MAYKTYGEAFKEIRIHKEMSLGELEYISGISKSTLSQFENGKLMLSFDKLDQALDAMYVTLQDYYFVLNEGNTQYAISQFNKIQYYFIKKRYDKLTEIYEINIKNGEKGTDLIALCAKICYSPLSPKELKKIEDYCTSGLEWSLYDIRILVHMISQLNLDFLFNILQEFFLTTLFSQYIDELASYREPIVWILTISALIFIKNEKRSETHLIIEKLEHFAQKSDLTAKIGLYFVRGCYHSIFISERQGYRIINKLSLILDEINAPYIKRLMWDYYQKEILANS